MRSLCPIFLVLWLTCVATTNTSAATIYVDVENDSGPWDGSPARPYQTIQDGIDNADDSDVVRVLAGTYMGPGNIRIDLDGKEITLQSVSGPVETVIDCQDTGSGFIFHSGETADTVVDGFTITNGHASGSWPNDCGGGMILWNASSPTIRNCMITDCETARFGGGIYCIESSSPTLVNCVIAGNTASGLGGGILLWGQCSPIITNCTIAGNAADGGGGIFSGLATPIIRNSIIWGNTDNVGTVEAAQITRHSSSLAVTFSCIQDTDPNDSYVPYGVSGGNIDDDPLFIDASSFDFRIPLDSPCSDSGTTTGAPETDILGKARPSGDGVDMGAYENQVLYVDDDAASDPGAGDTEVSDPSEDGSPDHPYDAIQEAIDAADDGGAIIVLDGTYTGTGNRDIDTGGRQVTIRSAGGPRAAVIDCEGLGSGFLFHLGETTATVVDGFTITNGLASGEWPFNCGGGMVIWNASSPAIRNCIITACSTSRYGGGVYCVEASTPELTNCVIADNAALGLGGGILLWGDSAATITNCTIAGNAGSEGGGIYCGVSNAIIRNSILWGNTDDGTEVEKAQFKRYSSAPVITYCCIQDDDPDDTEIPYDDDGTSGNIDDDPVFADAEAGSFNLLEASPCIDAGTEDEAPSYDCDGRSRPSGAGIDMGAYERTVVYVDDDAADDPGAGDPSISDPDEDGSQDHPFDSIQEAIDAVMDEDVIIVLDGTYTGDGNRLIDLGGKAIMLQSENGPVSTIIDCEGASTAFDFHSGETTSTVLYGFTITNGAATGAWPYDCGGGMIVREASCPSIRNCIITACTTDRFGGGIYCIGASCPEIINCVISGNTAASLGGGILLWGDCEPVIMNCTIAGNTGGDGGGIFCGISNPIVTNCILWGNTDNASPVQDAQIKGSSGAPVVSYSCIQDDDPDDTDIPYSDGSNGNIDDDPLFTDSASGDYSLTENSPCINAATEDGAPSDDVIGTARPQHDDYDIGAYESTVVPIERTVKLYWQNYEGHIVNWVVDGTPQILYSNDLGTMSGRWYIVGPGDVNADGIEDLILRDPDTGGIAFWLIDQDGTSIARGEIASASMSWRIQAIGDINGDGSCDLILRNISDGRVNFWMLNADGTRGATGTVASAGTKWTIKGFGDINGDGTMDLIWHESGGNVVYWMLNPDGSKGASAVIQRASTVYSIVAVSDIDQDGTVDIVWHRPDTGKMVYWMLNPDGTRKSSGVIDYLPGYLGISASGDLNGDGTVDFVMRHSSGPVYYWILAPDGSLGSEGWLYQSVIPSEWHIMAVSE